MLCLGEDPKIPNILSNLRVPFEEYKVHYAFLVKTLTTPSYYDVNLGR